MWKIVHYHIRIHAMALDHPLVIGTEYAPFGGRGDSAVHQSIARGEPDLSTPGARPDHLAQPELAEPFGERFAVRPGELIAQHHHVAAERLLHIPEWFAGSRLPIHQIG